jgi:hypothetical protein
MSCAFTVQGLQGLLRQQRDGRRQELVVEDNMSATVNHLRAVQDADREFFANHPRRQYRTRVALPEEGRAYGEAPLWPYSVLLQRNDQGGYRKLVVPESVPANLPEHRAAVVFEKWLRRAGL